MVEALAVGVRQILAMLTLSPTRSIMYDLPNNLDRVKACVNVWEAVYLLKQ